MFDYSHASVSNVNTNPSGDIWTSLGVYVTHSLNHL